MCCTVSKNGLSRSASISVHASGMRVHFWKTWGSVFFHYFSRFLQSHITKPTINETSFSQDPRVVPRPQFIIVIVISIIEFMVETLWRQFWYDFWVDELCCILAISATFSETIDTRRSGNSCDRILGFSGVCKWVLKACVRRHFVEYLFLVGFVWFCWSAGLEG